jgi:hypothetical protein
MNVLIIFGVLTFGGYSFGQVFTAKNGVVVVTNSQTQAQVIRVASGLRIGMREEDASWVLATNQLYSTVSAKVGVGWSAYYSLSNGCILVLDYTAKGIPTNGSMDGKGRLAGAFIQSNGVNIMPIALTNGR